MVEGGDGRKRGTFGILEFMADPDVRGRLQPSVWLAPPPPGVITPIYRWNNANIFHDPKNKSK